MPLFRNLVIVLFLCCAVRFASGQQETLEAAIKPSQELVRNGETFSISITVRNKGLMDQSFIVWDCSYSGQWKSDNPSIRMDAVACRQNARREMTLKPGESYTRVVRLHIQLDSLHEVQNRVTFKLGYGPEAYFGARKGISKPPLFWSNPVTVMVAAGSS